MSARVMTGWQKHRSQFNHDWLKNHYLQALGAWLNLLDGNLENAEFERAFVAQILPQWQPASREARALVQDFAREMSPRQWFSVAPLAGCDEATRQWLEPLVDKWWRVRYGVDQLVSDAEARIADADAAYARLQQELKWSGEVQAAESLRPLRPLFAEFRRCCQNVAKAIEKFPSEVKVA